MIRRVAKDPLVHFLLLGVMIFVAYSWFDGKDDGRDRIVIDQRQYEHLKDLWKLQWKREPAPEDVAALIDRHIRQEVFYREALRMNLDRNDEIIKRRLSQKMEAVANDLSTLMRPPTDEQLRAYFRDHEEFFMIPRSYALKQVVFVDREKQDGSMQAVLDALRKGAAIPQNRVNRMSLANDWPLTPAQSLDNTFGGNFSRALEALPEGLWSGPIRSGYGLHLVLVERRQAARVPEFEEVRDRVAREYEYRSVLTAQDEVYRGLLGKYEVTITAVDVPDPIKSSLAAR